MRNANGTGPFMLKSYEPDNRVVMVANPHWWGKRGNVDEAIYTVIQSDATRLAALASGQVDFVVDPPFQDVPRLKAEGKFKLAQTSRHRHAVPGLRPGARRASVRRRQGPQPVQGPSRAPRDLSGDRCRHDRREGAARTGDADRLAFEQARRRLRARAREAPALRPERGARAAEGSRLRRRIRRHARLRQRRVPRRRLPGDRRHARAGRHPRDVPAVPDVDVLPEADAGEQQLLRVRLDADAGRLGNAQRDRAQLRATAVRARSTAAAIRTRRSMRWSTACASSPTSPSGAGWSATCCVSSTPTCRWSRSTAAR